MDVSYSVCLYEAVKSVLELDKDRLVIEPNHFKKIEELQKVEVEQ